MSKIIWRDDDAVIPACQSLDDVQRKCLAPGMHTAVAHRSADIWRQTAQSGQPAGAPAVHVGPFVVKQARAGERTLQKAAVEPAGAAVPGDVLIVGEVLHAALVIEILEGIALEEHVL